MIESFGQLLYSLCRILLSDISKTCAYRFEYFRTCSNKGGGHGAFQKSSIYVNDIDSTNVSSIPVSPGEY